MNKQVKININGKDYYCDSEILKLIMRNQDKIELLEYNRDKSIRKLEDLLDMVKFYEPEMVNLIDIIESIISILRGKDNGKV